MQLTKIIEPFGEVNVYQKNAGEVDIVATILTIPNFEKVRMGLALDASSSMQKMYGISGIVDDVFGSASNLPNVVEPITKKMVAYLANFSSNGKVNLIYWACNPDGSQVEEVGELDENQINNISITGPERFSWGRETKLLSPLKYFIQEFEKDHSPLGVKQPAGFCVFITDGIIEDLQEVKEYSFEYARQIADLEKPFIKFVLIGLGEEIDEEQMIELDDMFEGSGIKDIGGIDIDLWDHQLAKDLNKLEQVFKEVVSQDMIVLNSGKILNQTGEICKEYLDGVPGLLRFTLPSGSTSFTLEFPGGSVTQDISEGLQ